METTKKKAQIKKQTDYMFIYMCKQNYQTVRLLYAASMMGMHQRSLYGSVGCQSYETRLLESAKCGQQSCQEEENIPSCKS